MLDLKFHYVEQFIIKHKKNDIFIYVIVKKFRYNYY